MRPEIHSGDIEIAVARLIGFRMNTIVPNVSWGLGLNHECDMLVLDSKGRFTEIEIKISASDLKADFNKKHRHQSKIISRLIYAMPDWLCDSHAHLIPSDCGLISVFEVRPKVFKAKWVKICKHDKYSRPSQKQIEKFYHLGCMRIWSLKENSYRLIRSIRNKNELVSTKNN